MTKDIRVPYVVSAHGLSDDDLTDLYEYPDISRPWIRANFVASLDGAATGATGTSSGLATTLDHRVLQLLRELADVVLVGASTARAENYAGARVTSAGAARRRTRGLAPVPPIAVVTGRADLDPNSRLLTQTSVPPIIFTTASAATTSKRNLADAGATVIELGADRIDTGDLLDALADLGLHRVICEGGPRLTGQLAVDHALDELCITTVPTIVGGTSPRITDSDRHAALMMACRHIIVDTDSSQLARWVR
ncbi:pyrimidine reductase family protein [Nocardia ninae]|uniref:Bacterial bifunctional deaminase-reductase C-terminal domain-containing protein n=1 Tax=Nocardia ninae NBRC 108245 TaxID=1210091 RepID=A0A511MT21_9NOCA|nr:pyrimidine reductase family protein [Nocardia ninae]GEM43733.1 hypothetical protein NN4_82520 [Nocardia ninae NBRC 108245]